MISISVIIPSYNSFATIGFTLDSLLGQSNKNLLKEVIVIDSSNDNKTPSLLSQYSSEKIQIIHLDEKTIPAIARNIGAEKAKGEILAFLDSDVYVSKNWLSVVEKNYSEGVRFAGGGILLPPFQIRKDIAVAEYFLEFNEYISCGKKRSKKFVPSCNIFCSKDIFRSVGGFPHVDSKVLFKSEDVLFCNKVNQLIEIYFIPEMTCFHICRQNISQYLKNQFCLGHSNLLYRKLIYKNNMLYRGFFPILLLPFVVIIKLYRIFLRIRLTGKKNFFLFLKVFHFFLLGLLYWWFGFVKAIFDCKF